MQLCQQYARTARLLSTININIRLELEVVLCFLLRTKQEQA